VAAVVVTLALLCLPVVRVAVAMVLVMLLITLPMELLTQAVVAAVADQALLLALVVQVS
jgi:hypothetical protein